MKLKFLSALVGIVFIFPFNSSADQPAPEFCANSLHRAVMGGNIEEVKKVMEYREKKCREGYTLPDYINERDFAGTGNSPIFYARSYDVLKFLLDTGADVNLKNTYKEATPTHYLVDLCSTEVIELLLDRGADINAYDREGETPLDYLVSIIMNVVFFKEPPIPDGFFLPGRACVFQGLAYADGLSALGRWMVLEKGAKVGIKYKEKEAHRLVTPTPMHRLVSLGSKKVVQKLIDDDGADINALDGNGKTPLDYLIELIRSVRASLVRETVFRRDVDIRRQHYLQKLDSLARWMVSKDANSRYIVASKTSTT